MGVKRPRALALYHAIPGVLPSAAIDARILAAARTPSHSRPVLPFTVAAAALLIAVFALRWMNPGEPASRVATRTDFGIAEGQSRAFLSTFHPMMATGPGSQEGKP